MARTRCYARYRRNGYRAVPLEAPKQAARTTRPCPYCGRRMRGEVCSKKDCRGPAPIDLRAIARAVSPRDPYPMETTSADRVLANPSPGEVEHRRQQERGYKPVRCEQCSGRAYEEPPCLVNGVATVVVRCRVCDIRRCAACHERPARRRETTCARCWTKIQRGEIEMPTATKNGKQAHAVCPYCKKGFDPIRCTQITCGGEACKKAHQAFLVKTPARKRDEAEAPPVGPPPAGKADYAKAYDKSSAALDGQGEGVQQAPPAAGLDRPSEDVATGPPASREHMAGPLGVSCCDLTDSCAECPNNPEKRTDPILQADPILRAVLALEALPRKKREGVLALVDARATARRAEQEAEELLASLRAS